MTRLQVVAIVILGTIALAGAFAPVLAPQPYDRQFRELPSALPQPGFPMGTDEVGRDRFSRLLYATRISVLLAPAAAFVSVVLGLLISAFGAWRVRAAGWFASFLTTLFLSLPWIFLFIILRAKLPLNTDPAVSVGLTFALMGVSGWAFPSRVFTGSIREIRDAGWLLQARAAGVRPWRIAVVHAWPHLRSVALAQFRVLVPACVLSEASLGLLGLGVADPLPSWGNLLRDLQRPDAVHANPWLLAPLGVLVLVMICLEALAPSRQVSI